jgi:MSHA biogenesis protein MshP
MKQCIRYAQKGFTMVTAIFILVVLAALGAFVVNMSTSQQITSAQDIQGARGYQAARAGIEWGIYQVLDPTNATVVAMVAPYGTGAQPWPNMPACPASPTSLAIEGFTVSVTCTRSAIYNENGSVRSVAVYSLGATASSGTAGSQGYVERQLQATVSKCRTTDGAAPSYGCQ